MIKYETKYSDELMHHGIEGQQWGKRNGPPYPLSAARHRAVVKRKDIESTKTQGKIIDFAAGLSNYLDDVVSPVMQYTTPDGVQTFPPVASVIRDMESKKFDKESQELLESLFKKKKGFEGAVDEVNPDYGEVGTTHNCTMCGAAMELRGKGYNVSARRSFGGASAGSFTKWFKGAHNEHCETFEEMKSDIDKDGDGSSGVLQGFYGRGLGSGDGGHTLHWRKENGKIIVSDGQNHTEGDWDTMIKKYGFSDQGGCIRTRLDNCDPNWDELAKDGVVDVGDKKYSGVYKEELHPAKGYDRRSQDNPEYESWYNRNKDDFEKQASISRGSPFVDKLDRWYNRTSKWLE